MHKAKLSVDTSAAGKTPVSACVRLNQLLSVTP